jgi:hypothetical protein
VDPQFTGLEIDSLTKSRHFPLPHFRRSRYDNAPRRQLTARAVELFDDAGTAVYFPLKPIPRPRLFETGQQSQARDRKGIANLNPIQPRHELPGASLAHPNEFLDRLAVEVGNRHAAQLILD